MAFRKIILRGRSQCVFPEDRVAQRTLTPGEMVRIRTTAGADKGKLERATPNAPSRLIVLDRPEINHGIDDTYAAGEKVKTAALASGVEFVGFVKVNSALDAGDVMAQADAGEWIEQVAVDISGDVEGTFPKAELLEDHAANASRVRRHMRML